MPNDQARKQEEYAVLTAALHAEASTKFPAYFKLMNSPQRPGTRARSIWGKLQRTVAKVVDGVVRGGGGRLAVSQPPQTGKSSLISKEYVSFLMGAVPGIQIAITGHSANLLYRFSTWVRDRSKETPYLWLFPSATAKAGEDKVSEWAMENGSRLIVRTVGQPLTGSHVDLLIIDDVYSGREQAESPSNREKVKNWYMANCLTRIAPNGSIICVNTRWHKEDLIGYLTSDEYVEQVMLAGGDETRDLFHVLNLPALCSDPEADRLKRAAGESVFPEFKSAAWFNRIRAQLDPYEWESQYQGNPQTRAQSDLDLGKIQYIEAHEVPDDLEVVRCWDLALSEAQLADFSAGAACAYDATANIFYIIDMKKNKLTWVKNRRVIIEQARRDAEEGPCGREINRMGIEAVAGFGATFQDVRSVLLGEVKVEARFPPKGGKLLRAQPWLNRVESRGLYLVKAPWNKDFLAELETFPVGEHDDQIDAVSGAWEMLTGRNRNGTTAESDPAPDGTKIPQRVKRAQNSVKTMAELRQDAARAKEEAKAKKDKETDEDDGWEYLAERVAKKTAPAPARPFAPSRPAPVTVQAQRPTPSRPALVRPTKVVRPSRT
jgi:predicted phage terminase large subunit-like protein